MPAEDIVDTRAVTILDAAIDILREAGEQRHGDLRIALLHDAGKIEGIGLTHVVHRQDKVETRILGEQIERLGGRTYASQRGRITHIQVDILLINLGLDVTILLENISIVTATNQQDTMHTVLHKAVFSLHVDSYLFRIIHTPIQ